MENQFFVDTCSKCGSKAVIRIKADGEDIFKEDEHMQILWNCGNCDK